MGSDQLKNNLMDILQRLDPYDRDDYTSLGEDFVVEQIAARAALIDGVWVPFSQMRRNEYGAVFVRTWLYEKEF